MKKEPPRQSPEHKYGLCLFCLLLLSCAISLFCHRAPAPVPAAAGTAVFSAAKAMRHIEAIGKEQHPSGSKAHAEVLRYLVTEIEACGLVPEVQEAFAVNRVFGYHLRAGSVKNIIVRLEGSSSTRALLFVAHYDSSPNSYGANDDGVSVAALLETMRILKAGPRLRNDIIFLFTDGEENGLLGSKAFVTGHPLAGDTGAVFNFEARGAYGPTVMFESGTLNSGIIRAFAGCGIRPFASSVMDSIYKYMPNATDFSSFKQAGFTGLNFAFPGGSTHYENPLDRITNVNLSTLQHQGMQALSLARYCGSLDLNRVQNHKALYFDVLGLFLVQYPQSAGQILAWICVLLCLGTIIYGIIRKKLNPAGLVPGLLTLLLSAAVAAGCVALTWGLIGKFQYSALPFGIYNGQFYFYGCIFLGFAIHCFFYSLFKRVFPHQDPAAGALLAWIIAVVPCILYLPGSSYLFTWPLLGGLGSLLFGIKSMPRLKPVFRCMLLAAASLPAILLIMPLVYLFFTAQSADILPVVTGLFVFMAGLLFPQTDFICTSRPGKLVPLVCFFIFLGCLVGGSLTAGYDKDHPKPNSISYNLDTDTGKAFWISVDPEPDKWTSQFLKKATTGKSTHAKDFYPFSSRQFIENPAPVVGLPGPGVTVLADSTSGNSRTLRLKIRSQRGASELHIYIDKSINIYKAQVQGALLFDSSNNKKPFLLYYFMPPDEGIELFLEMEKTVVAIEVVDITRGLPQIPGEQYEKRPDTMINSIYFYSDITNTRKVFTFQ